MRRGPYGPGPWRGHGRSKLLARLCWPPCVHFEDSGPGLLTSSLSDLDKIFRAQVLGELSDGEIVARRTNHHIQWYIAESDFAQYQNGLMSDEVFEAKKRNLTRLLSHCDLRDITDFRLTYFSQDFLELLASIEDPRN